MTNKEIINNLKYGKSLKREFSILSDVTSAKNEIHLKIRLSHPNKEMHECYLIKKDLLYE